MRQSFGYLLPKAMHAEFGALVKAACDAAGRELRPGEVFAIFQKEYLDVTQPYHLLTYKIFEEDGGPGPGAGGLRGHRPLRPPHRGRSPARATAPIDAFFNALRSLGLTEYEFVS